MFTFAKRKMAQIIYFQSLSGTAYIDRADKTQPSSERQHLLLIQPQGNWVWTLIIKL